MAKLDGTNGLIQQYDYQVLTTAFSYTFAAGTQTLIINPAGTLATGTITMPAAPADGMVIWITTTKQIVALTINGNTGQTLTSGVTSLAPNQAVAYIYRVTNTTWYPFETQMAQGNGPAFSAYQSTASISISSGVWTKLTINAEDFDTNNNFDSSTNYRFTPTVAGYYQIGGSVRVTYASISTLRLAVYKNGTEYRRLQDLTVGVQIGGVCLVYFNGTTDYVELYGFAIGTTLSFANEGSASYAPSFFGTMTRSA
tara:strand:- start:290 stop:1054 length:765 start_codon:yes stop_codon:yes gene_type:complete